MKKNTFKWLAAVLLLCSPLLPQAQQSSWVGEVDTATLYDSPVIRQ